MIDPPAVVVGESFQDAWIEGVMLLQECGWERNNLVVQILDPLLLNEMRHAVVRQFATDHRILPPHHVAYTIFPHNLYRRNGTAEALFHDYNRRGGLFERLHRRTRQWGTYFRRMTHYDGVAQPVNQLANLISAIRSRERVHKAAYTIVIQRPGGETVRPLGGPCLNYLAIQIGDGPVRPLGILAVYRNHDFLRKAYGNYWGLCNLVGFLAQETGLAPGPVTCISSHAYVDSNKAALVAHIASLTGA